ncbi:MAG: hypothetical protein KF703_13915 [Actinobacteria bacterium]|nr:hypothetical protein [Actinomycetota bacterium]
MPTLAAPAPARRAPGLGDLGGGRLLALAAGATLAVVGFRAGVVPGGQVGVDVLLAAAGWWFGSGAVAAGRVGPRWGEALHRAWPGALAALVGALVWVLLTEDTSRDRVVRGAALALLGGYGNWHQLSVGPSELGHAHLQSPLQHLWPWAVAAQGALLFSVLFWLASSLGTRRRGRPHPVVVPTIVVSGVLLAWSAAMLAGDASPARLLLDSRVRGVAFLLGAAVGAAGPSPLGRLLRSTAASAGVVALGLLGLLAVAAGPSSSLWHDGAALASPILAALAVAWAVPAPRRAPAAPDARPGLDPWAVLVAALLVHGPVLTLASPARTHLPWAGARVVGIVLVAVVAVAVAALAGRLDRSPAALERRRVLLPPAFVAVLILLLSATGAFHWEHTRPLTPEEIRTRTSQGGS